MKQLKQKAKKTKISKTEMVVFQDDVTIAHDNFEPSLSKRALYKTNNVEVSQDLVQTTFLKTLLYLQRGGKIDTMKSFLNHILNDLIIDEYRKNKPLSLDTLLEKGFEPNFDIQEQIINIIDGKKAILLIPSLPQKYQTIMRMRYLQSMSLKEISLITGQSKNTVAVQAHRGLTRLKTLYSEAQKVN